MKDTCSFSFFGKMSQVWRALFLSFVEIRLGLGLRRRLWLFNRRMLLTTGEADSPNSESETEGMKEREKVERENDSQRVDNEKGNERGERNLPFTRRGTKSKTYLCVQWLLSPSTFREGKWYGDVDDDEINLCLSCLSFRVFSCLSCLWWRWWCDHPLTVKWGVSAVLLSERDCPLSSTGFSHQKLISLISDHMKATTTSVTSVKTTKRSTRQRERKGIPRRYPNQIQSKPLVSETTGRLVLVRFLFASLFWFWSFQNPVRIVDFHANSRLWNTRLPLYLLLAEVTLSTTQEMTRGVVEMSCLIHQGFVSRKVESDLSHVLHRLPGKETLKKVERWKWNSNGSQMEGDEKIVKFGLLRLALSNERLGVCFSFLLKFYDSLFQITIRHTHNRLVSRELRPTTTSFVSDDYTFPLYAKSDGKRT